MHAVVCELLRHVRMVQRQLSRHVVHIHIVHMGTHVVVVVVAGVLRLVGIARLPLACEVAAHALVEGLHHVRVFVVGKVSTQPAKQIRSIYLYVCMYVCIT